MVEPTELARAAMDGAEAISRLGFTRPDEDWEPVLLVRTKDGEMAVMHLDEFFVDDERRTVFAERVLPALIEDMDVQELAIVSSVWVGLPVERDGARYAVAPRTDPARTEAVLVTSINAERVKHYLARITRSEDGPPVLAEWEQAPGVFEWGTLALLPQKAFEAFKARV